MVKYFCLFFFCVSAVAYATEPKTIVIDGVSYVPETSASSSPVPDAVVIDGVTYKREDSKNSLPTKPENTPLIEVVSHETKPSRYSLFLGGGASYRFDTPTAFQDYDFAITPYLESAFGYTAFAGIDYAVTDAHHIYVAYLLTQQFGALKWPTTLGYTYSTNYATLNQSVVLGYDYHFSAPFSIGLFGGLAFNNRLYVDDEYFLESDASSTDVGGVFGAKGELYLGKHMALGLWYAYYTPGSYNVDVSFLGDGAYFITTPLKVKGSSMLLLTLRFII